MTAAYAGPCSHARWVATARILSLPGLLAGVGGLLVWSAVLIDRTGVKTPQPFEYVFLGAVAMTSIGTFVGAALFLVALIIALTLAFIGNPPSAQRAAAWRMVLAGFFGTLIAGSALAVLL